jgi:hypothetical protein
MAQLCLPVSPKCQPRASRRSWAGMPAVQAHWLAWTPQNPDAMSPSVVWYKKDTVSRVVRQGERAYVHLGLSLVIVLSGMVIKTAEKSPVPYLNPKKDPYKGAGHDVLHISPPRAPGHRGRRPSAPLPHGPSWPAPKRSPRCRGACLIATQDEESHSQAAKRRHSPPVD